MSWLVAKLLLLFVLLLLSGFFSGSETALVRIGKVKARALLKRGVKGAETIDKFVSEPETMLTTVLIGNNVVNIAASALATSIAIDFFGNYGAAVATGVMTFLILTFAEIMPKTIAVHHAERISLLISKPMGILTAVFQPLIKATSLVTGAVTAALERLFGVKLSRQRRLMTEEEVETMLEIGEEEGAIEEDEKEMMKGVLRLDEVVVKNVMVPREEMVCLEASQPVSAALEIIKTSGYSRIPVLDSNLTLNLNQYLNLNLKSSKETRGKVVGVLYAKDLLIQVAGKGESAKEPLRKFMKTPYFVPESKRVDDLLAEFQKGKFHLAIVVDEEGRTKGLVSLEDLLEVIVGSIYDEYDTIKTREKR